MYKIIINIIAVVLEINEQTSFEKVLCKCLFEIFWQITLAEMQ